MKNYDQIPWHELPNDFGPQAQNATKVRERCLADVLAEQARAEARARLIREELNDSAAKWLANHKRR